MLGTTFYNSSTKKLVVAFGNLFNNVHVRRYDEAGATIQDILVPILYGAREKYIAALEQGEGDEDKRIGVSAKWPRMAFEITGITYDTTRKINTVTQIKQINDTGTTLKYAYTPVPYDVGMNLVILSRNAEDCLQAMEQIVPYFTPSFNITINEIPQLGVVRDVPVILNSVQYTAEDESNNTNLNTRKCMATLSFTMKAYFYGPVKTQGAITKVIDQFYADLPPTAQPEDPTSTTLTNADSRITISVTPAGATPDDYGFTTTKTLNGAR